MTSTAVIHRPPPTHLSDSDSSESDSSSTATKPHHHTDFSNTIFRSYIEISGLESPDLTKIQSFLTSSRSGALSCLICLERIRPTDPTWSCSSRCFAVFHLLCIQSWARQSSDLSSLRGAARGAADHSSVWNCPKCRIEFPKTLIPKIYTCFCGKIENPPHDPWILPHSCGEICERSLTYDCGHRCLLLCHPGPCPACPKLVKARCFCGGVEDTKRCRFKNFSCNKTCSKLLDCKAHCCVEICHDGGCPPCKTRGVYNCYCGKVKLERECFERDFRCEIPCEKRLGCGKHYCGKGCHKGECGDCPLQGRRTCPCGKRVYEGMACDVVVPSCGGTCDKKLQCGVHRCPERCHRGPCVETCRIVVTKSCKCGSLKKQVPCYQDVVCERKCQQVRDCGRHACRRKCCDGDCPPCSEICDKKLRCKNHKCPSPCHRGACAPCPVMVTISCFCGETHFEVPCGTEKEQKPPKCSKRCHITPLCRHKSITKPHKCHYGACPLCRLVCDEEYPCGHKCKLRCHGPIPSPNPEFTLRPKKKKQNLHNESTPGSACPPCPELVWRPCVGEHIGAERMMVCSNKARFSCDNYCGNLLPCGNHFCTKTCHDLKIQCEECNLPCQRERKPLCPHPCPLPCHHEDCPPCKVLIKRSCHCGAMVHVFGCLYFNTLSEKEQIAARSCGGPCHRKLPNCTHLCPEICHVGQCPSPEKCSKKIVVKCKCQTVKKDWPCHQVQAAYYNSGRDPKDVTKSQFGIGLLSCNSDCKSKVKADESDLHLRKSIVPEKKESDVENHVRKRKRRKDIQHDHQDSTFQKIMGILRKLLLFVIILVSLIAMAYFGYKGLLWVNDWMNEMETQRHRKRYPRI